MYKGTAENDARILILAPDRIAAFWQRVQITDECWLWTGPTTHHGYGTWSMRDGDTYFSLRPHRVAWVLAHGCATQEATLDHLCRNRACVNPAHLEEVSQAVNNSRKAPDTRPIRSASLRVRVTSAGAPRYCVNFRMGGKQRTRTFDCECDALAFIEVVHENGPDVALTGMRG